MTYDLSFDHVRLLTPVTPGVNITEQAAVWRHYWYQEADTKRRFRGFGKGVFRCLIERWSVFFARRQGLEPRTFWTGITRFSFGVFDRGFQVL